MRLHQVRSQTPQSKVQSAIRRDVLRLALPAMGEQMLSMMVGIVDTYLVGHLGAAPLAAVGLANQWVFLATTLFGSVGTGATALIARFIGARDPDQADRALQQAMLLGVGIGLLATLLGVTLARPAVLLLGAPDDVIVPATDYLRLASTVFFFSTLMFIGNASLRGAGDTRTPLFVMLVVNGLNIVVAWAAINGHLGLPRMGVVGSALGAVAGRLAGGVLVIAILLRGRAGIQLKLSGLRSHGTMIKRILHVGLPTGLEQLLMRVGWMTFARILTALGTVAYAANQVGVNGWSLSFMPGFGFALAATTLVGQSLGAQDPEGAQQRGYTAYWMGGLLMGLIGVLFILFPAQIVGFFTDDPAVIAVGTMPLRMMGFIQPLLAATMIFAGGLRGAGDTRFPMIITGASIWLIRLPLAYLFAIVLGWGLTGAWGALIVDMSVRGIANFMRFRGGRWKSIQV